MRSPLHSIHLGDRIIDTELTEENRGEVCNRAIALLEKLPEAMLDEAV